jgi:hypothetical protein
MKTIGLLGGLDRQSNEVTKTVVRAASIVPLSFADVATPPLLPELKAAAVPGPLLVAPGASNPDCG